MEGAGGGLISQLLEDLFDSFCCNIGLIQFGIDRDQKYLVSGFQIINTPIT